MIPKILIDQSISSAVNQEWNLAIEINLEILQYNPYHIPTLNRLAKAYRETGQIKKAINTYKQTLELDKYNTIAQRSLKLIASLSGKSDQRRSNGKTFNTDFIDEPGLTRTIPLVRLADPQLLFTLEPGQVVTMCVKNHIICVTTQDNDHVGALTDDVAYYLKKYIQKGYKYLSIIKTNDHKSISIFVKEVSRPHNHAQYPTFSF